MKVWVVMCSKRDRRSDLIEVTAENAVSSEEAAKAIVKGLVTHEAERQEYVKTHQMKLEERFYFSISGPLEVATPIEKATIKETPLEPIEVSDWNEGEDHRMVGNTMVYRSYEAYCMD